MDRIACHGNKVSVIESPGGMSKNNTAALVEDITQYSESDIPCNRGATFVARRAPIEGALP